MLIFRWCEVSSWCFRPVITLSWFILGWWSMWQSAGPDSFISALDYNNTEANKRSEPTAAGLPEPQALSCVHSERPSVRKSAAFFSLVEFLHINWSRAPLFCSQTINTGPARGGTESHVGLKLQLWNEKSTATSLSPDPGGRTDQ